VTSTTSFFAADDAPSEPAAPPRPTAESDAGGTLTTSTASGEKQAALVDAEDMRITQITSGSPPSQVPYEVAAGPQSLPTTVLTARSRPYDLPALVRLGAAEHALDGAWVLTRSVVVAKGATLNVQQPGAVLRMTSGPGGFASIVAFKGGLMLAGDAAAPLTITSWDPITQSPDVDVDDGRAYIRAVGGRMDVSRTVISGLGFWSGRTGGLAWTGSATAPSMGSLADADISRNHYGVFTSRSTDLVLSDSAVYDNDLDGVLVHREATRLTARNITTTGNGRDGIALVRGAAHIAISGVTAARNAGDGIRIDGSPLAETATAGGASTARGAWYLVERSTASDNAGSGIEVVSADGLVISGNTVSGSVDGIVVRGPATMPQITGNTVDATGFAIAVRAGVTGARLRDNTVGSAAVGLSIADSVAEIGANTVTASRYGMSLVGDVSGTSVIANRVTGRGLAAVDLNRIAVGATADVAGNDQDGWVTDRDNVQYWTGYAEDHPLLLLWLLILLIPIAARLWATRRRRAAAHPYENVAPGPAASEALARAPLTLVHSAPRPPARRPDDVPVTTALPVTRVTVVSGQGARR
jgi:parallel beta-helix repeat protein